MKHFIRAMGSELEKPAVLEAARRFDYIHTGHYGYKVLREARAGDHIYCTTGRWQDQAKARAVAALRGCVLGFGVPDGKSLLDENGKLRIPLP